jgi:hypothetical protein
LKKRGRREKKRDRREKKREKPEKKRERRGKKQSAEKRKRDRREKRQKANCNPIHYCASSIAATILCPKQSQLRRMRPSRPRATRPTQ